jgi:hypothetical protein
MSCERRRKLLTAPQVTNDTFSNTAPAAEWPRATLRSRRCAVKLDPQVICLYNEYVRSTLPGTDHGLHNDSSEARYNAAAAHLA